MQTSPLLKKTFFTFLFLVLTLPLVNASDIYLNDSGSCSDAYTRTQALNPATPFCSPATAFSKALSGDKIIADLYFRDENIINIDNFNFNQTVTLTASVKPRLNITFNNVTNITTATVINNGSALISGYLAGVTFTNISNATDPNLWISNTVSTGSTTVGCDTNTSMLDSVPLYPYDTLANMNRDKGQQIGTFFNGSNIFVRYTHGRNPNTDGVQCYKGAGVSISNSSNIVIDGIMFTGGTKVVYIDGNSLNITVANSTFKGGASRSTLDLSNATNIIVELNYFGREYSLNFTWCSLKG